ncbi:MAG TPA: 7-carboxy-7-deazaguanine synthase QueE [Candidatus Kryptonia bacterium]|nr:7-carboxy-7-deazaguanine synthase QueE [Candidatus Kryptonia bacterium]
MIQGYASELFVSFQGEGAHVGERHLFVRMAICNLRCRYCDTPDSLVRVPHLTVHQAGQMAARIENPVATDELARRATNLLGQEKAIDAVAITGGEPLVQAEFVADFLRTARFGLPVLLETNGVLPHRLRLVLPWVTIISMDIKPPSNTGEPSFWDEHAEFLRIARDKEVYVKLLVDRETSDADVTRAAELVSAAGGAPLYLQPIMDRTGRPEIGGEQLSRFFALVRERLSGVRVLPQTHKILGIQ